MKFLPVVLALVILIITGCGGSSSSSTTTVAITVTPTQVTLTPNQSAQFTATVTNSTNTGVTWQVNGVEGGNTSLGVISTTGSYTAPGTITVTSGVTITAIAQADTTKTATAAVVLNPTNVAPAAPVLVSPSSATLSSGAQQTFTATVSGAAATVNWSVSCPATNPTDCGTITQSGVYTAPLFPPPSGTASITATDAAGVSLPGNAPVTIRISNQSLFGQYAFALSGKNGGTVNAVAGSVTFDGQGNITGGTEDVAGGGTQPITGGTYHIGTDGRGNLTLQTSAGTSKWQLVMVNHSRLYVASFDNVSTGTMDVQTSAQFDVASIQGNYGFNFTGASSANPTGTLRSVGAVTADGAGGLSAGLLDRNDTGTAQTSLALSGTFTAPSSSQGRGTLSLTSSAGTQTYVYYIADGTRLKLLETDASANGIAELLKQNAGPFTLTSIRGSYVTAILGANSQGPVSTGGIFTLDGSAGVKATLDTNNNGNTTSAQNVTGTYAVTDATTGRTTLSWTASDGPHQFVMYPSGSGDMSLLETDSASASGPALPQLFQGFSNGSFSGNFAALANGTNFSGTAGPVAFVGQLIFNGGSAITGVLDINDNGSLAAGSSTKGSYSFDSTGRATLNVTSGSAGFAAAQLQLYAADSNRAVYINADSNRVLSGIIRKQF